MRVYPSVCPSFSRHFLFSGLCEDGAEASFARWLHLLRDCEQPQPQGGESSKNLSRSDTFAKVVVPYFILYPFSWVVRVTACHQWSCDYVTKG